MTPDFFQHIKPALNQHGISIDCGLTYKNGVLNYVFPMIQRLDSTALSAQDMDYLAQVQLLVRDPYIDTMIRELTLFAGLEQGKSINLCAQDKLQRGTTKIYFQTQHEYEEVCGFLDMVKTRYHLDFTFEIPEQFNAPIYGFTLENNKITNIKAYFETENALFFDPVLLAHTEIYPYTIMYSWTPHKKEVLYEYWSFKKWVTLTQRLEFTKKYFQVDLPQINPDYFEYKEFQYSRNDDKMNFYFFDTLSQASKALNDNS